MAVIVGQGIKGVVSLGIVPKAKSQGCELPHVGVLGLGTDNQRGFHAHRFPIRKEIERYLGPFAALAVCIRQLSQLIEDLLPARLRLPSKILPIVAQIAQRHDRQLPPFQKDLVVWRMLLGGGFA